VRTYCSVRQPMRIAFATQQARRDFIPFALLHLKESLAGRGCSGPSAVRASRRANAVRDADDVNHFPHAVNADDMGAEQHAGGDRRR